MLTHYITVRCNQSPIEEWSNVKWQLADNVELLKMIGFRIEDVRISLVDDAMQSHDD